MIHEDLSRLFNHMNREHDEWVRERYGPSRQRVIMINALNDMFEDTNMDTQQKTAEL
jgi:hypothetical protein